VLVVAGLGMVALARLDAGRCSRTDGHRGRSRRSPRRRRPGRGDDVKRSLVVDTSVRVSTTASSCCRCTSSSPGTTSPAAGSSAGSPPGRRSRSATWRAASRPSARRSGSTVDHPRQRPAGGVDHRRRAAAARQRCSNTATSRPTCRCSGPSRPPRRCRSTSASTSWWSGLVLMAFEAFGDDAERGRRHRRRGRRARGRLGRAVRSGIAGRRGRSEVHVSVLVAFVAAVLFGCGTWLLLQRRLSRIIIGVGLLGHGQPAVGRRGPSPGRAADHRHRRPERVRRPLAAGARAHRDRDHVRRHHVPAGARLPGWQLTHDDQVEDDVEDRYIARSSARAATSEPTPRGRAAPTGRRGGPGGRSHLVTRWFPCRS
jgi:multicomponent Na+:H+ antiporter subunit C